MNNVIYLFLVNINIRVTINSNHKLYKVKTLRETLQQSIYKTFNFRLIFFSDLKYHSQSFEKKILKTFDTVRRDLRKAGFSVSTWTRARSFLRYEFTSEHVPRRLVSSRKIESLLGLFFLNATQSSLLSALYCQLLYNQNKNLSS